jgi:hypothetical protein
MKYRTKPYEVSHRRWVHRQQGYIVVVLEVLNFIGKHGHYATVKVKGSLRDTKKEVTWSAERFLADFAPKGRKMKAKTALDHLTE